MNREQSRGDAAASPTGFVEIDRVCDRFESAWRAGQRPTIDEYLGEVAEPVRSELLRELLATELECRLSAGELPLATEYQSRYPGDVALVEAAFGRVGSLPGATAGTVDQRPSDTGRNLLLGLLALQNNFIDREALLTAFSVWVSDKSKSLGGILLDRGVLDGPRHVLLEALVGEHLKLHGGEPQRSLAALAVGGSTRETLKKVGDPGVDASLAHAGAAAPAGGEETVSPYAVDISSAQGRRFRVLRPHAEGGLGAVFVALDSELNREVALKQILDRHADNEINRARFLMEAEITARLEHPGIVPVYGLGTYSDGRPYYAMRFIKGDSLKDALAAFHADTALKADLGQRSLELRKLLRRFVDVCNAIDYAHSRGVLHRDVKPGNVIVGKYGETLVVDWGLAKPMGHDDRRLASDERTLWPSAASGSAETLPGTAMGTPAYMSPEQAAGEIDRLGPRSDVYSLGATLYSLLTGRAPFGGGAVAQIFGMLAKGAFPRPREIDSTIDRALEAICLKAMALKPDDRYATPRALADDVERWVADEPVLAWREPLLRRARRWAWRNRTAVASAVIALVAAVVALSALAAVQNRANRELKVANDATTKAKQATELSLDEVSEAKKVTEFALAQSEESRQRALAVLRFLKDDVVAAARPEGEEGGQGGGVTVRKAVDAAEPKIARAFKDQPAVEAEVRDTLGTTYHYLGEPQLAIPQLRRVLELRQSKLGPDHGDTLKSRNNLAVIYETAGRTAQAIELHEGTLKLLESKLGPNHRDTLSSRHNLATAYASAGDIAAAIELHEETLKRREMTLGPDHPHTLISRHALALAYKLAGRTTLAIKLDEETLKLLESNLGPDHPMTLTSRSNLAAAYEAAGRTSDAIKLHEETLKQRELKLGLDHLGTLASANLLAESYRAAGRIAEAINLHKETLRLREIKLGRGHRDTLISRNNLALDYESLERWADAEPLRRDNLDSRRKSEKTGSPALAFELAGLGLNLLKQSKWAEAEAVLREWVAICEKSIPDDWRKFNAMSLLGGAVLGQRRFTDAEPLIVQGFEGMKAREQAIRSAGRGRLSEAAERVVRLYESWGKPETAAQWKAKVGLSDLPKDVFAPRS